MSFFLFRLRDLCRGDNNTLKRIIVALGLLAAPLACPSTTAETTMYAPFSFTAGDSRLAAGEYRVRTELTPGGVYRIYLQNNDGHQVLVPVVRVDAPNLTKSGFIFRCESDGSCQLTEVRSGGGPAFRLQR